MKVKYLVTHQTLFSSGCGSGGGLVIAVVAVIVAMAVVAEVVLVEAAIVIW